MSLQGIGQLLQTYRAKVGMGEAELANSLLLGTGWVEAIERGAIDIPVGLLLEWASVLGVTPSELLGKVDTSIANKRTISATQNGDSIDLRLRFGQHPQSLYTLSLIHI